MRQYQEIVREILENGVEKGDRTGTGTLSVFGIQKKYDLSEGFPLVTVKKTLFDAVIRELLWLLNGSTNINDNLTQHTPIWDAWADEEGELGPIYGYQWRKWPRVHRNIKTGEVEESHIDQIQNAIDMIKNNPESRRIIVNAWNVGQIEEMALPPCHTFFQFYVADGKLSCQLYQRSADVGLGVPFNIASYSALLVMMAQECGLKPGTFVHTMGDAHIYRDHIEDLKVILDREPLPLPTLKITKKPFWDIKFEDFELVNYQHHPFIKLPVSV